MDGHFHHDIRPGDVVAWPTNIGWMMGPWLIYAALLNRACIALYEGLPGGPDFARFIERAGVSMLGVVPSLVRAWRESDACADADWSRIEVFSSTGEPSNRRDYLWLTSLTGHRAPVIEYCGGTEIGGGYVTGTAVQPASPSTFTTPALGLDIVIIGDDGVPLVTTHGWTSSSTSTVFECIDDFSAAGLRHVLCTDVSRDGAMSGPNHALYRQILGRFGDLQLQASGGVRNIEDLAALRADGLPAAITGRAILDGKITAQEVRSFRQSA